MTDHYARLFKGLAMAWLALCLVAAWGRVEAQSTDGWKEINRGFSKCAAIGQSAGTASWPDDGFEVLGLMPRAGQVYAFIQYRPDAQNTQPCEGGLFRFDTVATRWIKVAGDVPRSNQQANLVYHEGGIWLLAEGQVYEFTHNSSAYPNGWKPLSSSTLLNSQVFSCACSPAACPDGYLFRGGLEHESAAIGDTLFVLFRAATTCPDQNNVGKFSLATGTWSFQTIGKLPNQGIPQASNLTGPDRAGRFHFADRVGGRLRWFYADSSLGKDRCIPYYLWVWDGGWKNISQGIDWTNRTATSNPQQCLSATRPAADWGRSGGLWLDRERRTVYASSETGIWRWGGDRWYFLQQMDGNSAIYPIQSGLLLSNQGRIFQSTSTGLTAYPDLFQDGCAYNRAEYLVTQNEGRIVYAVKRGMKAACLPDSAAGVQQAIAQFHLAQKDPTTVSNLHLDAATYLGGPGANEPIGVGVGGKSHVFVAGNFDQVLNRGNTACHTFLFNGTAAQSRGRVFRLNALGDSVISVSTLGNQVYDYEMQNYGRRSMVVSGDFGVSMLDSGGIQLWHVPSAQVPGGSRILVDVDDQARVAVLRSAAQAANGEVLGPAQIAIYGADGAALTDWATVQGGYLTDIAVRNDTVFVTGFTTRALDDPSPCPGGVNSGSAIDVAFVRAYRRNGRALTPIWSSFDFSGSELDRDPGSTRGYRLNFGRNGRLYFLGESGGGTSAFRWNGKTTVSLNGCADPATPLVVSDRFTDPAFAQTVSAYYAQINPATGEVQRSQFLFPLGLDPAQGSFRTSKGYIHADAAGHVYLGDVAGRILAGRNGQQINGQLVDGFSGAGDMTVAILRPDFSQRLFWGTFSAAQGEGRTVGIGIGPNSVALLGSPRGRMYTGSSRSGSFLSSQALHPDPYNPTGPLNPDAYLAVWQTDVGKSAALDPPTLRSDTSLAVLPSSRVDYRAGFTANQLVVCQNQPVVFTNASFGDSTNYSWDFGDGASLPPGTTGPGPHSVTYSTIGPKTVRLQLLLRGNTPDAEEKRAYVTVLPQLPSLGAISGPRVLCAGAEAVYSVPPLDGITSYSWTFPAGFLILGDGTGASVRVRAGGGGGNISVFGRTPCGNSTVSNQQTSVQTAQDDRILLVAGNLPLTADDQRIKQYLLGKGYDVLEVLDSVTSSEAATCAALVIIAPTATARGVGFKFRDVPTPVITLQASLFPLMALTYGGAADFGIVPGREGQVINNAHELGNGIPLGLRPLYTQAYTFQWGTPGSGAVLVAHDPANPGHGFAFGYDEGSTMRGSTAPARRVALYIARDGFQFLARDGFVLFDRALCWTLRTCSATASIQTGTLARTSYCPGDTVSVPYVVTGSFNNNRFLAQLSDARGDFSNPVTIGSLVSNASGVIRVVIPVGTVSGSGYRVRVVSSNPSATGTDNGTDITIGALPPAPVSITGRTQGCIGQVLTYTTTAIPNAFAYQWQLPHGVSIVGDGVAPVVVTRAPRITLDFGLVTSGEITVQSLNRCGVSAGRARLAFQFDSLPPSVPAAIQGPDTVCNAIPSAFAVPADPNAASYQWLLPQGVSTASTTAAATLNFSGLPDDSTVVYFLRARNGCGYGPWQTDTVRIDNQASIPPITGLRSRNGACPGTVVYTVDPVPGATAYTWLLPPDAQGASTSNRIEVSFDTAATGLIRVLAQTPCGPTDTLDIPVSVAQPERRAMLYVHQVSPLTAGDSSLKARMEQLGYVVQVAGRNTSLDTTLRCNKIIVVSSTATDADNLSRLTAQPIPLLSNQRIIGSFAQFAELKLTRPGSNVNGTFPLNNIILNPTGHPIGDGLIPGDQYVYETQAEIGWGLPEGGAVQIAQLPTGAPRIPIFTYEPGAQMAGITAPARRVGFFLNASGLIGARPEAVRLFDNAVCWLTGGCRPRNAGLTDLSLTDTVYCAGTQIRLPFTANGVFDADNRFSAILSDPGGSFTPGTLLQPDLLGTGSGTLVVTLPDTLPSGSYFVRIVSSAPYIQGPTTVRSFRVLNLNTSLTVSAGRVCPGQPATVTISPTEPGIVYQPHLDGLPASDSISGTGTSVTLPVQGASGAVITVRAHGGTCPSVFLADTASYRTFSAPGPVQGLEDDSVCAGSNAVLSGLRGESGTRYTLFVGGQPVDSVLAGTASFQFTVPAASLADGLNTLTLTGRRGICAAQPVAPESITLFRIQRLDTTLSALGGRYCSNDSLIITLSDPQTGVAYTLVGPNGEVRTRRRLVNGNVLFTVDTSALAGIDSVSFRILARAPRGCFTGLLASRPSLVVVRYFEQRVLLLGDTAACLNTLTSYEARLGGLSTDSIAWSIPKTARPVGLTDEPTLSLRFQDYPGPADTLRFFARSGCGILSGKLKIGSDCDRLFIPNIFTPLTNDRNNAWDIRGLEAFPNFSLQVFNTEGQRVHQIRNSYAPWDGRFNGSPLPSGTYYYVLRLGDGFPVQTGSITIIR